MAETKPTVQTPLPNYINGEWQKSAASEQLDVMNPATGEVLTQVPLSPSEEVHQAATDAATALHEWRRTPPVQRIQYLFTLKNLLEENLGRHCTDDYVGMRQNARRG